MKLRTLMPLTIVAIFLMTFSAYAYGPHGGKGPLGSRHLSMLQEELDLTADQVSEIQEVFADGKQTMLALFAEHDLDRGDMRKMRRQLRPLRQQGLEKVATILNPEQRQVLREEIMQTMPMSFAQLAPEEKIDRLQDLLSLSSAEAEQLEVILAEGKAQHDTVLATIGIAPEQFMAFQQGMAQQRQEIHERLSHILNDEQLADFEEMRGQMKFKGCGHGPGGMGRGKL